MRGDMVIVKDWKGRALVRKVWSIDEMAVYIVTDDGFKELQAGGEIIPAGFRREAVFRYSGETQTELSEERLDWSSLEPYSN